VYMFSRITLRRPTLSADLITLLAWGSVQLSEHIETGDALHNSVLSALSAPGNPV